MKFVIGIMAPLLIVGFLFWQAFLTPLAICAEKGGMYVEESRSCVCSDQEGLFICVGAESEATAELIEKVYKNRSINN